MRAPVLNGGYNYVVALPARDEAERIICCLDACSLSMRQTALHGAIALLINNTSDETARLARDWAAREGVALYITEKKFSPSLAHAGSARRAAFDLARSLVRDDGFFLTTDADTLPSKNWIRASLEPLITRKASMVCGSIQIDPLEAQGLPGEIAARGEIEDRYSCIARELTNILDPDPVNTWPFHGQESGASLAVTVADYDRVGGLPVVPVAEDRALARRFREHDLPILYSDTACVTTSCRIFGRAEGGMACTISQRMAGATHICDERLEPACKVRFRAQLRARLRRAFKNRRKYTLMLEESGLDLCQGLPAFTSFGALWAFVENNSPSLSRRPMTWDQMYVQLPTLEALRDEEAARSMPTLPNASSSRCKV